MVFVWGYYSDLFEDITQCNVGFRFGTVKLKFDMLMEWNILVYDFIEMSCLCEVVALICFKILLSII